MNESLLYLLIYFSSIIVFFIVAIINYRKNNGLITRKGTFKILDRLIVMLSIIVILISVLFDFNYIMYKSPIEHSKWRHIALNDFRGLKRPYVTLDGGTEFAFISTSIRIVENRNSIRIVSLFHPSRSYVYNRNLYSDGLLVHEMYHFHITEYYARLIRKEVKYLVSLDKPMKLNSIKIRNLVEEQKMQYKYDDETYHGYILEKQLEWQNKIDSSLLSLEKYSETIISLKK